MCGIAGIFHLSTPKPVDPARVRLMIDAIAHRGPDGEGVWTGPGVGLGHRRLSIIDLAGGDQPMASADGRLVTVFNGEIYNYRTLRAELEALGHVFRTHSDTECILHGWRAWGAACLDRFTGMFAFALYDAERQSLVLARDRLGVKPLFYAELADGTLLFGSELKALLAHPRLRRAPDFTAVEDYLAFGYVPDDACLVAGVKKLAAAHLLVADRGRPLGRPQRWWDIAFSAGARGTTAALEEELVDHMREAVRSRMIADVPLGAFLSGGVDSSSVVALMAEASRQAVETCSIGFDVAALDETDYARQIAARFATAHRERLVSPDSYGLVDALAAAFDEPFADASALPGYSLCALARERVTVALSGDGADEAMAGYRRHRFFAAENRARALLPEGLRAGVFGTLARHYPKADWAPRPLRARATFEALARDPAEAYARAVGVTPPEMRARLYTPGALAALAGHRAEDRWVKTMRHAPAEDWLGRAQYADLMVWLPGDILTKVDRTSMAHGLEVREPLLDHRLLAFEASLPAALRLRGGQGKWLMKRAMRRYLPDPILYRPKMGFVTPIAQWFRGALAGEAERIAQGARLGATGWFAPDALAAIAAEHRAGRRDHGRLLWQLLMLEKALGRLFGV
ncbi:XrtA/PEP-CTERM system amidotransferase [Sphingomonas morindae]|uniref:asparagine synthase (glutamine-hydrolyzing) n=1 Tax=Sphingomonas morindae TaxID=1541170 RepID=A0ABY4X5F9_9SPHN|nr:XrtA/PEP-CTERM system amidotransferase [Sphingomonas morindae]USI72128.1 amidotransferase 1, exosortase A system-associated [Sphingomonas morindae]